MSRPSRFILVLTTLALLLSTLVILNSAAAADDPGTIIIGSNDSASRYPIGLEAGVDSSAFPNFQAGGVYQQVYAGSAFPGPITITQLAFASSSQFGSGPGTATYNFNIALGTTGVGPNGLSTNLAANRGTQPVQVFSGEHTATLTANNQFDVVIDIVPFTYDPANGNLLLEVSFNSPVQFTGGSVLYFTAGSVSSTSRAANPTGAAGGAFTDSFGLRTRFTVQGSAQVILGNQAQTFDGSPKSVSVTTNPPDLAVVVTYDGSATPPINAGSYAVTAIVNDPNFTGQASGNLTINKADQQIIFGALPNKTVGDADFGVGAAASSNLAVSLSASGNCTLIGTQVHLNGVGPCTITASQDGNANINPAAPVARTFSVGKADQQITFEALTDKRFGDPDFGVSATASSNLAVSLAALGSCTLTGAQVHLTGSGLCTITATQDGDANINAAAPVARTFSIGKADQQITFEALTGKKFGDPDFAVSATASSNLAVAFSAGGDCTMQGSQVHIAGAGSCTITATQDGDVNNNGAAPVARTFSIGKVDQQITFDALSNKTVGDADFGVSATASSNLAVAFSAGGNCTIQGAQVHITAAGLCTITATQDGDANINAAAPVERTFSIGKADQQITFGVLSNKTVGDADFGVSATASSNLVVSFSASGDCTLTGDQVHLSGAGQCTITASQDGDANINVAAPVSRTFAIGKADQQITFNALADKKFGDPDFGVVATASSNLAVAFSAAGNCTVSGTEVHIVGAGACTITASQDGNANINAAPPAPRTFQITKADQQINFDVLAGKNFGDTDFSVSATASSNLAVSFSASGACTVSGTQVHLTGAGLCTITAAQDGDANINAAAAVGRSFSIEKANQQITFDALVDKKFGDADFGVTATASTNLAVTFSAGGNCTVSGTQVHIVGAGPCTITASQDGDANINTAAPVARTFSIGKADQQITFDALGDRKFGDADFDVTATASSNLNVSLASSGNCALNVAQVHVTSVGLCTITASQDGDSNYNAATTVARTFTIAKADQQINFDALGDKKFSDPDFNVSATASSNLAISFAAAGNCTIAGTQVHLNSAGLCTISATQDGDANINAAAPVARTFAIGKADQQITFDALPDKKLGDADFSVNAMASSNLAISFAASGSCTASDTQIHLTGVGPCTITASQDGSSDYNQAVGVSRTFTVTGQENTQALFSFISSNFEVAESVGSVRITVTRSGDTSGPATVDYATDDTGAPVDCAANSNGLAISRCDFNAAIGTLTFLPGEAEKTFDVLITRDSRVEMPAEIFTVKLSSPTGGVALGTTSSAVVQIDDTSGSLPPNFNVIDDSRAFVRQQYHDFLNREPDPAGLAFWVDNIEQCNDPARRPANLNVAQCKELMRVNTSAAFFLSIEFSQSGGLVHAFYAAALDRPNRLPGYFEFVRDTEAVGRGVIVGEGNWQQTLNDNRDAFMKDFVMRPEFVGLYPTVDSPAAYVNRLYLHALGRAATPTELDAGVGEFGDSSAAADPGARARVLLALTKAPDFSAEVNRSFVHMQYIGYLRRNANELPDENFDGYEFWLNKLNSFNGNYIEADMVKAFLVSGEYRARFGP